PSWSLPGIVTETSQAGRSLMWKRTLLVALIASAALANPPPKPKPGMSKEQEALFKEAEALVRSILGMIPDGVGAGGPPFEETEKMNPLSGRAAAKYTRLAESMGGATRKEQDMVRLKAGRAWMGAGEPAKALPLFDEVARRSNAPQARVNA